MKLQSKHSIYIGLACIVASTFTIFYLLASFAIEQHPNRLVEYQDQGKSEQAIEPRTEQRQWEQHKAYVSSQANATLKRAMRVGREHDEVAKKEEPEFTVHVWQEEQQSIAEVPLEEYVIHVALSELPWTFHDEAVKAQLIAARTYIMHRASAEEPQYAQVSDSTKHQVYRPVDVASLSAELQQRYDDIVKLAKQTEGMVMTYEGKPIDALYFSTSNGKTAAAEDYFNEAVPYLKSVDSQWDSRLSPSSMKEYEFTYEEFYTRLIEANALKEKKKRLTLVLLERTTNNRVAKVKVNDIELTARQLREMLGLASTDFSWKLDESKQRIVFAAVGYGHGVGMSQWGAQGMALEGYSAAEILQHYYTNIEIESL